MDNVTEQDTEGKAKFRWLLKALGSGRITDDGLDRLARDVRQSGEWTAATTAELIREIRDSNDRLAMGIVALSQAMDVVLAAHGLCRTCYRRPGASGLDIYGDCAICRSQYDDSRVAGTGGGE